MAAIDDLQNLPLSHLFSAPLVAAIDATLQAQSEQLNLLLETGFDDDGELVMVAFDYVTSEIDPDTGNERQVSKRIKLPLLLFMSLPELVIHRIEEEFSVRITEVQDTEGERPSRRTRRTFAPALRLNVAPAGKSTTFARKTEEKFDLDIKMVAELENQSTGIETLQRAANNAIFEEVNERRTERLAKEQPEGTTIGPGREGPQ